MNYYRLLSLICALCAVVSSTDASIIGGRRTYINYNRCGLWNDNVTQKGFFMEACCPVDASYPGNPWQQLSVSYRNIDPNPNVFKGNHDGCNYTVISERALSQASGVVGIEHVFKMGVLTLTKTEEWDFDGQVVHISFKAKYTKEDCNCRSVANLTVMHAVDPDPDFSTSGTYLTLNDVVYNGEDGLFAEAVGQRTCHTLGYGICGTKYRDGSTEKVGFTRPRWHTDPQTDGIFDPDNALEDNAVHYQHREKRALECGDEREFHFFVTWGPCYLQAREGFFRAHGSFCKCDRLPNLEHPPHRSCEAQCPCQRGRGFSCSCDGGVVNACGRRIVPDPSRLDKIELSRESLAKRFLCNREGARSRPDVAYLLSRNPNLLQEASETCGREE